MKTGFELFEHTADMGVRACAPTLSALFFHCVEGLYYAVGSLHSQGGEERYVLRFAGTSFTLALRNFLAEALSLLERTDAQLVTSVQSVTTGVEEIAVSFTVQSLSERSSIEREVKAITYHGLSLEEDDRVFKATYIIDI
jgi:SHS2 domain-containing protein